MVIITLISIIIYKIAVYSIFDHMSNGSLKPYAATLSSVSGSILQLIAITVLSQVCFSSFVCVFVYLKIKSVLKNPFPLEMVV